MGKRKKKGRPSLLDVQKRSLVLNNSSPQNPSSKNQQQHHNHSLSQQRRHTRRNPLLETPPESNHLAPAADDDDDDEIESDHRREKKLKLVLQLPHNGPTAASPSDDGDGKPRIRDADQQKTHSSASKAMLREAPSVLGPTTPLPAKKLLLFILDRLQKKDTYGVFSEPVDSEELPDYHDVIKHPMDFATIRMKLDSGAYQNLEQFEKDVFLISSNAMTYNAPETIYHRQARAIQELAIKNFEDLRHESDNEPDTKVIRRGRPSLKTLMKKTPGRPVERPVSELSSDGTLAISRDTGQLANTGIDLFKQGLTPDRPLTSEPVTRSPYALRETRTYSWSSEQKVDVSEEVTGSLLKGGSGKYGKKTTGTDENRRNTYKQPLMWTLRERPILSTFDGERKQLVPVGLHVEHGYGRSLARFAANLGPVGWEIAAQRIQKSLPPGTKFGRGLVGDGKSPQHSQPPLLSPSPPQQSQSRPLPSPSGSVDIEAPERQEPLSSHQAVEEGHSIRNMSSDARECKEGRFNLPQLVQVNQKSKPPMLNGLNHHAYGFDASAHAAKMSMMRQLRPPGNFSMDPQMSNAAMLDMVSRSNSCIHQAPSNQPEVERTEVVGPIKASCNNNTLIGSGDDSQSLPRGPSQNLYPKQVLAAPDLNVSFQSPNSPGSQQPDLALQL